MFCKFRHALTCSPTTFQGCYHVPKGMYALWLGTGWQQQVDPAQVDPTQAHRRSAGRLVTTRQVGGQGPGNRG